MASIKVPEKASTGQPIRCRNEQSDNQSLQQRQTLFGIGVQQAIIADAPKAFR